MLFVASSSTMWLLILRLEQLSTQQISVMRHHIEIIGFFQTFANGICIVALPSATTDVITAPGGGGGGLNLVIYFQFF